MTNLIVISSESDVENEAALVNSLFAGGLKLFHLRKPDWSEKKQIAFLSEIDPGFLPNISVHQHYASIEQFGLGYCHVKEKNRVNFIKQEALRYSTSFHNYSDLQFESHLWNYCFLSPVFDSISKTNYKSNFQDDLAVEEDLYQRVFALGGINRENIGRVFEKGFYGAAVLGAIWNQPEQALKNFRELNTLCRQNAHTF